MNPAPERSSPGRIRNPPGEKEKRQKLKHTPILRRVSFASGGFADRQTNVPFSKRVLFPEYAVDNGRLALIF
jgi:hypothetical protein